VPVQRSLICPLYPLLHTLQLLSAAASGSVHLAVVVLLLPVACTDRCMSTVLLVAAVFSVSGTDTPPVETIAVAKIHEQLQ
jgi:hypothetical protein